MREDHGLWITDRIKGLSFGMRVDAVLEDFSSQYQRITVVESATCGRTLLLDNIFNVSTVMDPFYHEAMTHIPLGINRQPEARVLVIGGGDYGIAKELVKHSAVDVARIDMVELDADVLRVAEKHFPQWSTPCKDDPRFQIHVGDGQEYVSRFTDSYDCIIIDSTDPFESAEALISPEFYAQAYRALRPGGVIMQIVADYVIFPEVWADVLKNVSQSFSQVTCLGVPVPFYMTGAWGLLMVRKGDAAIELSPIDSAFLEAIPGIRTLTPGVVRGYFDLPAYIKDVVEPYVTVVQT